MYEDCVLILKMINEKKRCKKMYYFIPGFVFFLRITWLKPGKIKEIRKPGSNRKIRANEK
jgi:hypothetical protein